MIVYINMVAPNYGKNNSCWRRDIQGLLSEKGYAIVSRIGRYWKVDTTSKNVFASNSASGKIYDEKTSFDVLRNLL